MTSDRPKVLSLHKDVSVTDALKRALLEAETGAISGIAICVLLPEGKTTWECAGLSTIEAVGLLGVVSKDIMDETME